METFEILENFSKFFGIRWRNFPEFPPKKRAGFFVFDFADFQPTGVIKTSKWHKIVNIWEILEAYRLFWYRLGQKQKIPKKLFNYISYEPKFISVEI